MEWRLQDGKPVAAIVGRWRLADEQNGSNDFAVEGLLIIKVTPTSACAVAIIGGLLSRAMATAGSKQSSERLASGAKSIDRSLIRI